MTRVECLQEVAALEKVDPRQISASEFKRRILEVIKSILAEYEI